MAVTAAEALDMALEKIAEIEERYVGEEMKGEDEDVDQWALGVSDACAWIRSDIERLKAKLGETGVGR